MVHFRVKSYCHASFNEKNPTLVSYVISHVLPVIIVLSNKVWFELGCKYDYELMFFCYDNIMHILIVMIKNDGDLNSNATG